MSNPETKSLKTTILNLPHLEVSEISTVTAPVTITSSDRVSDPQLQITGDVKGFQYAFDEEKIRLRLVQTHDTGYVESGSVELVFPHNYRGHYSIVETESGDVKIANQKDAASITATSIEGDITIDDVGTRLLSLSSYAGNLSLKDVKSYHSVLARVPRGSVKILGDSSADSWQVVVPSVERVDIGPKVGGYIMKYAVTGFDAEGYPISERISE